MDMRFPNTMASPRIMPPVTMDAHRPRAISGASGFESDSARRIRLAAENSGFSWTPITTGAAAGSSSSSASFLETIFTSWLLSPTLVRAEERELELEPCVSSFWALTRLWYTPLEFAIKDSCVPSSTTCPSAMTTILSAPCTVARRCAIMIVVRPFLLFAFSRACRTVASLFVSRLVHR